MPDKLVSFEELFLDMKTKGIVKDEYEMEALLIYLVHVKYLEKQVFPDTNTIWYRRTGKTIEDLKRDEQGMGDALKHGKSEMELRELEDDADVCPDCQAFEGLRLCGRHEKAVEDWKIKWGKK